MADQKSLAHRFRGYFPVIVDVETGGVNAQTDALLEIAAIPIIKNTQDNYVLGEAIHRHIVPFEGANLNPDSLAFNKIDPFHPFRYAVSENEALKDIFSHIRKAQKLQGCKRSVLVGHNAWFDLHFVNEAAKRTGIKRNPFHPFTCFDTATLSAIFYGHTVLAETLKLAKIPYDNQQSHSAIYDATVTGELFCQILNQYNKDF